MNTTISAYKSTFYKMAQVRVLVCEASSKKNMRILEKSMFDIIKFYKALLQNNNNVVHFFDYQKTSNVGKIIFAGSFKRLEVIYNCKNKDEILENDEMMWTQVQDAGETIVFVHTTDDDHMVVAVKYD